LELEEALPTLEVNVKAARSTLRSTQADADAALERVAELTGRASSLETDIVRLQERRDASQIATETAKAATEEVQATLRNLRAEQGQIDARVQARNADLTRLNERLSEGQEQLADLQEKIDAASAAAALEAGSDEEPQLNEDGQVRKP